ncbi:sensor domain-containing diguanylate cyclase [Lebetimonas sp. JS138]|uniref:sensor domain-containing diguanylate cyclase n=1 Tax=Lebetimonas sp. JS138 TaxID=990072 RepID=UPI000A023F95|nr:sensor domain-containing diguanylate cyclase [Lebetimonas sp. JS138]
MKSLKKEIFKRTIILILLMISIFGILTSLFFYQYRIKNTFNLLKTKNSDVSNFIRAYFKKFYIEVEYLSRLKEVRFAPFLSKKERKKALYAFKLFQEIDKNINYVYSGYKNKMLLINNYTPPPGFDPTIRPWYRAAIKSFPNISQGIPYREIKTKEWLVSISKALVDDRGKITGVISIDTSINKIIKKLNEKSFLNLSNFIIRDDGLIIVCHNKFNLNKNFIGEHNVERKIFNKSNGFFEYYKNHIKILAYFTKLKNLGWIVITVIDKNTVLLPIIKKIIFIFLIVSIISVILGIFYTHIIYKEILSSLDILHSNVREIVNGNVENIKKAEYPFKEFAEIKENIENLTKNALYKKNKELQELNALLKKMALTDKLTGLYNRYKFNEELKKEIERFKRYKNPFCLIMFDIDNFKQLNDTYGHDMGDKVLKEIAKITTQTIRKTDIASRWGGEEFMIICPNTFLKEGIQTAQRLRKKIESHNFGIDRKVTISVGISEYNDENIRLYEFLKDVDDKLYQAKKMGKNTVVYQINLIAKYL